MSRRDLRLLWIDLKNTFGSVPHALPSEMMSRLAIPLPFISSSIVKTKLGETDSIPLLVGFKQGRPPSPLLFNLALQVLLSGLDLTKIA